MVTYKNKLCVDLTRCLSYNKCKSGKEMCKNGYNDKKEKPISK